MRTRAAFRAVGPYLTAAGVFVLLIVLGVAIYFTLLDLQWIAFLAGVLVAAVLALVSRASRAEWLVARRDLQLQLAREKLADEIGRRKTAEAAMVSAIERLRYTHAELPAMLVCLDARGNCCYHNRAFRNALGLEPEKIDGRNLAEVLGRDGSEGLRGPFAQALAGRAARCEQILRLPSGAARPMIWHVLPHRNRDGKIEGVYVLLIDAAEIAPRAERSEDRPESAQQMFVETFSDQATGWSNAADHILAAMEDDGFRLYAQRIAPLDPAAGLPECQEILIRLAEEEENLMAPGAFLPIAEKYGLMPKLDRWVVRKLLKWAAEHGRRNASDGMLCINVAPATIGDPDFARYVAEQRATYGIAAGVLCFEVDASDAVASPEDSERFVAELRRQGCHATLCGFGRERIAFDTLKAVGADYLKIDGRIILNMLRNRIDLAKVTAISKVAKTHGVRTIAEYVESGETVDKLRELGLDYAQGFEISRPAPLEQPAPR